MHICGEDAEAFLNLKRKAGDADQTASVMGEKRNMDGLEKINSGLLATQVEARLKNYILEEPIEIGEKIPNEFTLAEMFGVGRGTIREAVKSLVSKGILEVRRGLGTYVISTSTLEEDPLGLANVLDDQYELALQLFETRLMFEPEIAALASVKATPEEKEELIKLCDEVEKLFYAGKNHLKKDIEFHTHIEKCSKNKVTEVLLPIIYSAVYAFTDVANRKLRDETVLTHRTITDSIVNGDSIGARNAMIMHLNYNRQMILELQKKEKNKKDLNKKSFDGKEKQINKQ